MKLFRQILLIALISSFILEITLSLFSMPFALFRPNTIYTFNVDSTSFKGISDTTQFIVNSNGYRGSSYDADATYHILTIGGSTTECFYLNEDETWPFLLQKKLASKTGQKIWVGNLGKSGLNSYHHIAQLEYQIEQFPKIDLVIFLIGINDMLHALKYYPNIIIPSENNILSTTFAYFPNSKKLSLSRFRSTQLLSKKTSLFYPQKQRSLVYSNQNIDTFRQYRLTTPNLITTPISIINSVDLFKKNALQLQHLCKKRQIKTLFLTQPYLWKDNMTVSEQQSLWLGANGSYSQKGQSYFSPTILKNSMSLYNHQLKLLHQNNNITLFDLEGTIDKSFINFYDGMHFNELGAEHVSTLLVNPTYKSITN